MMCWQNGYRGGVMYQRQVLREGMEELDGFIAEMNKKCKYELVFIAEKMKELYGMRLRDVK